MLGADVLAEHYEYLRPLPYFIPPHFVSQPTMNVHRPRTSINSPPTTNPHALWSHSSSAASDPALAPIYPLGRARPQAPRHNSDRFGLTPRRPTHLTNYPPSTTLGPEGASGSSTPNAALKVFSSVKRSFSITGAKKSIPSASVRKHLFQTLS